MSRHLEHLSRDVASISVVSSPFCFMLFYNPTDLQKKIDKFLCHEKRIPKWKCQTRLGFPYVRQPKILKAEESNNGFLSTSVIITDHNHQSFKPALQVRP